MKQLIIILICFLCLASTASAQYMPADIIAKADSVLIAAVGQHIFDKHFVRDQYIRYKYKSDNNSKKEEHGVLVTLEEGVSKVPTKGYFEGATIWYTFYLKADKSYESIVFDANLNVTSPITVSAIPECLWNNDTCIIITPEKAIELAQPYFTQAGVEPDSASMGFERHNISAFCWTVSRITWQEWDDNKQPFGDKEIVLIDATTGVHLQTRREEFGWAPIME